VAVPRALRRGQPGVLGAVAAVLARLHQVEINAAVRATAGAYPDPVLRSPGPPVARCGAESRSAARAPRGRPRWAPATIS